VKPSYSTINARAETIQTAASYREPFKQRRCLVPATGWYEWQKLDAKRKQPFHFKPKHEPFALAGVYDVWKGGGQVITSFAIVTTDAAPSWLCGPPDQAVEMMKPYPGEIEAWEVPAEGGNVRNNRPQLMERVAHHA